MAAQMKSVFSSTVDKIGYDDETGNLIVQWKKGRTSQYVGVPPELAKNVINSWSVGESLHNEIKPHFPHRYADE